MRTKKLFPVFFALLAGIAHADIQFSIDPQTKALTYKMVDSPARANPPPIRYAHVKIESYKFFGSAVGCSTPTFQVPVYSIQDNQTVTYPFYALPCNLNLKNYPDAQIYLYPGIVEIHSTNETRKEMSLLVNIVKVTDKNFSSLFLSAASGSTTELGLAEFTLRPGNIGTYNGNDGCERVATEVHFDDTH